MWGTGGRGFLISVGTVCVCVSGQESGLSLVGLMWCHELVEALTAPKARTRKGEREGMKSALWLSRVVWSTLTVVVFVLFRKWHAGGDLKIGHEAINRMTLYILYEYTTCVYNIYIYTSCSVP